MSNLRRILIVVVAGVIGVLTGLGVVHASASSWAWCSSAQYGTWAPKANWVVQNDEWGPNHGSQTVCANSVNNWQVTSTQNTPGTVESYPDNQRNFNPSVPLSSFKAIYNSFNVSMPENGNTAAEAADDVWFGHGQTNTDEMMVWVDTENEPQNAPYLGETTNFGQTYKVYEWAQGGSGVPEFMFVDQSNETSGQTHILSDANWLVSHGYMASNVSVISIPFGFEIQNTGNAPEVFNVNKYTLTYETK